MIGQVTNAEFYPIRINGDNWKTAGPEDEKDDNDEYWGVFLESRNGSIDWHDTSMAEKVLQNSIDIMKDCDWDCQKFGSGLTLVALLNYIAYLIIWINSIIFFTSPGTLTFPLPKVIFQHFVDFGDLHEDDNDINRM